MSTASEKYIVPRVTLAGSDGASISQPLITYRMWVLFSIMVLAAGLRVYGITTSALQGDEYNSIAAAKDVSLNWNSFLYSLLTNVWMRLGGTEFWLRLPAVVFGVATVPVLFRVGEKISGWRTGIACALIAATSPFNIYHSQEMRFYSLFMFASALFMLATIHYLHRPVTLRTRLSLVLSGLFLILSHFLGVLVLCAQTVATIVARPKTSKRQKVLVLGGLVVLSFVPLIPFVQEKLWAFYRAHAAVTDFALPSITGISSINFAKVAFALYTFGFGYHVYPLRIGFVVFGTIILGILSFIGLINLWKRSAWAALPLCYLWAVLAIYFVLNSAGGHVSSVLGPRHVSFAWPIFVLLIAVGLSSFKGKYFSMLAALVLTINAGSMWLAWQKDWSPGPTPDYRAAADYASQWNSRGAALVATGRSIGPIEYYFSKDLQVTNLGSDLQPDNFSAVPQNQRLIVVSDDWGDSRRREIGRLLQKIGEDYVCVDGRVDYPLFEYVFDRKPIAKGFDQATTLQLEQPLTPYGLEFQDLRLPVSVTVSGLNLRVIGASELSGVEGRNLVTLALSQPVHANKLILLTNITGNIDPEPGKTVAEVIVEGKTGTASTIPLRVGWETNIWGQTCQPGSNCQTVFQWHKRMAVVGQNSYQGAWRDFTAGIHATTLALPEATEVTRVSIRYRANAGNMYVWGVALDAGEK